MRKGALVVPALCLGVLAPGLARAFGQRIDARQAGRLEGRALDMAAALGLPRAPEAAVPAPPRPRRVPIPPAELGAWIRFEGSGSGPAGKFLRQALMRMQETPEGRELLAELARECRLGGRSVQISLEDFPGSRIAIRHGTGMILGIQATAQGLAGAVALNRLFMELGDREAALELAAATLAHELRHIVSSAAVMRSAPELYLVFKRLLLDEQSARLTGYLVSARLNAGAVTYDTVEIRSLAADPEAYWDDLKLWTGYAMSFSMDELESPAQALAAKSAALAKVRDKMLKELQGLPALGAKLAILEDKEGLRARLAELRGQYEEWVVNLPLLAERYEDVINWVDATRGLLASGQDPELARGLAAAAKDPVIRKIEADFRRDQKALLDLVAARGLPEARPTPGQIGWKEFHELVRESQAKHPEYWYDFHKEFGK